MLLTLQLYDFVVQFTTGKCMQAADTFFRPFLQGQNNLEDKMERVVYCLVINLPVSSQKLKQIVDITNKTKFFRKFYFMSKQAGRSAKKACLHVLFLIGI